MMRLKFIIVRMCKIKRRRKSNRIRCLKKKLTQVCLVFVCSVVAEKNVNKFGFEI